MSREDFESEIDAFETVVGNLQPILARVPNFIEQAAMAVEIGRLFTQSQVLASKGFEIIDIGDRQWQVRQGTQPDRVTFYPAVFDEFPSLRLLSFGEPLCTQMLSVFDEERDKSSVS